MVNAKTIETLPKGLSFLNIDPQKKVDVWELVSKLKQELKSNASSILEYFVKNHSDLSSLNLQLLLLSLINTPIYKDNRELIQQCLEITGKKNTNSNDWPAGLASLIELKDENIGFVDSFSDDKNSKLKDFILKLKMLECETKKIFPKHFKYTQKIAKCGNNNVHFKLNDKINISESRLTGLQIYAQKNSINNSNNIMRKNISDYTTAPKTQPSNILFNNSHNNSMEQMTNDINNKQPMIDYATIEHKNYGANNRKKNKIQLIDFEEEKDILNNVEAEKAKPLKGKAENENKDIDPKRKIKDDSNNTKKKELHQTEKKEDKASRKKHKNHKKNLANENDPDDIESSPKVPNEEQKYNQEEVMKQVFKETNSLKPKDKSLIKEFIKNNTTRVRPKNMKDNKHAIVLNEEQIYDGDNKQVIIERLIFEMDYSNQKWTLIKKRELQSGDK